MQVNYGLKPGDKITVMEETFGGMSIRECKVVKEYKNFIVADFGQYHEGINKARERCRAVLVGKGWLSG